jgi:hypothetical protein
MESEIQNKSDVVEKAKAANDKLVGSLEILQAAYSKVKKKYLI